MKEILFEVREDEEGGYIAEAYLNANEQIITQGDTITELKTMIIDAIECHFEGSMQTPNT
jgi:predicted RNase H-like HicB family nuclease